MSAPDYTDDELNARSIQRERFAPGTRVEAIYGRARGTVVKLHVGTLKRQKPLGRWTASIDWDDAPTAPRIYWLKNLRPIAGDES